MRKRTTSFVKMLIFTLLTLSTGAVWGQVTINSVIAQSPVDFAGNSDFSVGELTVSFNMPTGKTSGELQVNLAAGIEYMSGTVTATGATVSLKTGSTDANKPVFTLTGASGIVTVKFKRKATKAVLTNPALAGGLQDEAVLTVQGLAPSPAVKNVVPYQLPRPTLAVQLPTTQTDVLGARTETFDIRNTGNGIVKDVYFSIAYDHRDVVGLSVSHNGTPLTQVGTVPIGLPNAGKPIYKIANANLANNGVVTITEKYTVNKCTTGRQNTYYAYWGSGIANSNDIFETNSNTRNISVSTGIPIIRHSDNSAFNYFKWQDGFCGNILGTYYVRFNNETADPKGTAYNVEVKLFDGDPTIGFSVFEPINIRLVATDGTEIPISATGTGDTRIINFTDLAAVSNASLGSRDVGFTDEDGDGFKDDLKKDAYFQIAFDLKRKQSFQCLQPGKGPKNYFSLQPRAYVLYDNVCKGKRDSSDLRLIDYGTMRIYFNGVNDASKLPAQLVQNVPSAGYIAPGMNWPSLGIHQRTKNTTLADNERQFKYVITTPAGIKLQNVKLYRKTNIFGASPTTPVNQPDIEAGTTVTITTTNTPAYRDLTSGYLSFDALLQSCNGATAPITYSVYLMVKNGDGTYCDIPLVCNQVTNIPTICSTSCTIQGPRMLSTKVERADNSYGWKDYTMAVRQTRANVSSIERMRALYLDDIEFISEGQQHTGKTATNLFYYAKVENTAKLEPKKITLRVNGGAEQTFTATSNNPMRGTDAAGKNYFRWNLTSLFPTGTLPAGATFTAVATYQVKNNNPTNSNERTMDIQSGIESFFYTLDNPATDVTISTEGYHTAEKHCGANLTPIFYIAETQSMLATNEYKEFSGCNIVELGGNLIYAARRFKPGGTYFSQEFRPARLTKKITIKMPSAYRINNIKYTYTYKIAEAAKEATVDMSRLTVIDDGTWKTYTYINPPKGTTGHLPPGMITVVNDYNEYLKVFIQPSCKAQTVDGNKTYWDQGLDAKAMNEMVSSNIEYEDYYYHYAETGNSAIAIDKLNDRPILFAESKKPEITIEAISQLTVKANKRVMEATFKLKNIKEYDAPFGWISVPDVAGIEVLSLEEGGHTYTAQNSISGEKMFFLSDKGNDGKVLKNTERQFKLKYKITNCAAAIQLKVYAGWNCNGNPTTGYRNTCSDKFITYNITVAQSKKEIRADATNPGESNPDKKGSIPMCVATPYSYEINSADEGDLYDTKLIVNQGNGITFSDVEIEYPLGSGVKYYENTGVKRILHTTQGNKHIYDLSNVLPGGTLPGSISEPVNGNKRKFKLTFKVKPDCEFSAGSSFDIDIEGNNLCSTSAAGDKTRAIIAGIAGVNINDYTITLDPLTYVSGNGTLCGGGVVYKTRVTVNSSNSTFQMGPNARLRFTIPEGYELAPSYARYYARTPYGPGALWSTPVRKQAEEKTLVSGSELVMEIPAGMTNGQFFEFGIHIIQKSNALIDCTTPKELKVIATDTKTGVMCGGTTCPPMTVSTSKEEKVAIKNEHPKLSLKDVSATSTAQAGKENLTIKYKIENGTGTDVAVLANGTVKAALYYDANHNNIVDTGDIKLSTHTTTALNLAKGVTSAEQSFTFVVDQDKVCRLLLVLKNEDNVCLCGDVVAPLTAPEKITGLVDNLTVCESETKKVAYSAAGASYDQYTWTGKTANDKLDYLSAANVKEPNFHYNGTKLTATQTFTYILTVKRTNGCEATQEVKVTVQPAPSISTQPIAPAAYCQGVTATALTVTANTHGITGTLSYQWYSNTSNSTTGGTPVGTNANSYVPLTTTAVTLYYYVKITNSTCGEVLSDVVKVEVKPTPDKPTIDLTAESCTAATVAKISNYVSSGVTCTFTKADGTPVAGVTIATDGVLSGLAAGTYKVKVEKDGCTSDISDSFEIKAQKAVPAQPTVTLTAESCAAPTKAVISNYVSGQTYWNGATQLTVDGTSHEITGLAVGTYTITAKNNDNCESIASDSFEIKAQKAVPVKPTVTLTAESCVAPTKVVISNYVPGQTYWNGATQLTVDNTSHEITGLAVGTYTITAKNNDNCESVASDSFEIKAQKAVPAKPIVTLTAESCAAPTKAVISNYVPGQTYWNGATQLTVDNTSHEITSLAAGTYTITAKNNDNCESVASDSFEIKAQKAVPVQPTVTLTAESCVAPTKAVISNYVPGQTYWNGATQLTVDNTSHEITGLAAGTYTITAKNNDNCESVASDSFEIKAQKAVPAKPTIDLTAESCATPTKVVISNYVPGQTYWNGATQLTVNNTSHEITGLAVGNYTITAKNNDNCESVASDSFVIKAQKAATIIGANPQSAVYVKDDASATPLTAAATGMGTLTYKWYKNTTNSYTGGTEVGGNNTYTPATDTVGSLFYWAEITGECGTEKTSIAEIKVVETVPVIEAVDDVAISPRGGQVDVLHNDTVGGNPATLTNVAIAIVTDGGLTGVTVDPTTGKLVVPNTATPDTYDVTYKICLLSDPNTCDTAVAKITVTSDTNHTIEANDDPETQVAKGGEVDVLHNDKVDGNPATPTNVDITIPIDGGLTGITINPATGKIKIPTDATPGAYDITYQICVKGATAPCDTAKVRIIVTEDVVPTPTINANDDPETQVAKGGVVDVLSNDRVNGDPATAANVDITIANEGGLTGVTADPATGKIKVPDNATPATYEVEYRICVKGATSPCDTAKAKITVTPDATPSRPIKAVDDDFGKVPNTVDYTTTNTVFSTGVDTLEGVPGTLSPETDVILHKGAVTRQDGTAVQDGTVTMNDNGSITVKQGTPVGVYTYTYSICEKAVPTNCSEEAKVTFEVVDNTILAKDDVFEMGTLGGLTPSVLNNDIFAGKVVPTTNEVIIEPTLSERNDDPKLKMRFIDGRIDVEKGIAPGPHKYYYTISDKNDKTKNSSAVVTIRVVTFTAGDDEHELPNNNDTKQYIDKSKGIFANDEVKGERPEPGKNVTFRSNPVKNKDGNEVPGIVINQEDGSITIEPNTPDGVYTYSYTICKIAAPNECKTAKGVLKLLPALKTVDDLDFKPVNTTKGAVKVGNVLANDEYAGKNVLDHLDKVTAKIEDNNGGLSDVKIDEQGNLIIPQGTPVGVYDLEYNLCMKEHPGVCKTAKVRVEVIKDKPLTIYNGVSADGDGHNDYFKIDGIEYYPKNNLKIFNRWGVLVYEKDGYSNEAPFDGHSNGRATISAESKLPQGTYYYILEYQDTAEQTHTKKGWLYLKY